MKRRTFIIAATVALAAGGATVALSSPSDFCEADIDFPKQKDIRHVMVHKKTGDVTWTMRNGSKITFEENPVPKVQRVVGTIPPEVNTHALGRLSMSHRRHCLRHGVLQP